MDEERLVIKDIQNSNINNSYIKAEVYLLSDDGVKNSRNMQPVIFKYNASENSYTASLENFSKGVYAMNIHVDNDYYSRDLISGFVIGNIDLKQKKSDSKDNIQNPLKREAVVMKNSQTGRGVVRIDERVNTPVIISVFDSSGRLITQKTYKEVSKLIELPSLELKGVYIIKVSYNAKDVNVKYIP